MLLESCHLKHPFGTQGNYYDTISPLSEFSCRLRGSRVGDDNDIKF